MTLRTLSFLAAASLALGATPNPNDHFNDQYKPGPDSMFKEGVPHGKVIAMPQWHSKIYDGTVRDWWIYVPAQYDGKTPAAVMVFQDGGNAKGKENDPKFLGALNSIPVFDNLIAAKEMPVTIGIYISPGSFPAAEAGQKGRSNRSFEYDSPDDTYAKFLLEEILPEVSKTYKLTDDPERRAICGGSSGGICAFKVAWERPDSFRKVVTFIGSFTNIRGGYIYPPLIRQTNLNFSGNVYNTPELKKLLESRRKIRVFSQDGSHDLDNQFGNWPLANQDMAAALKFAGWDYQFVLGEGTHSGKQITSMLPEVMRWLWRAGK